MFSCFKLSVFVFIMGVYGTNKPCCELNHAAIPHPDMTLTKAFHNFQFSHQNFPTKSIQFPRQNLVTVSCQKNRVHVGDIFSFYN